MFIFVYPIEISYLLQNMIIYIGDQKRTEIVWTSYLGMKANDVFIMFHFDDYA